MTALFVLSVLGGGYCLMFIQDDNDIVRWGARGAGTVLIITATLVAGKWAFA